MKSLSKNSKNDSPNSNSDNFHFRNRFSIEKECLKLNQVSAKRTKIELEYYEDDHRKIQKKLHMLLNFYILDIF